MKKIYFVITGVFLILLIITSVLLSFRKKSTTTQKNSPFPTSVPTDQQNNQQPPNTNDSQDSTDLTDSTNSTDLTNLDISTFAPVETEDFKLQYSYKLKKIVVEKKTPQAEEEFINWALQNKLTQLIENPDLTLMVDEGKNPDDFNPVIEFLNIFMNMGQGSEQLDNGTIEQSNTSSSTNQNPNSPQTPSSTTNSQFPNFTYFPQCGDLGETSLPDGCNLCQAGCGPTAVSMIATSYLGEGYDPKAIVNLYRTNKPESMLLGCDGSRYSDAKRVLENLGLKTTDYLVFNSERSDSVVPDLRKYLNAGWTFFTLASFCEGGCGHYFWITDIDTEGNIFAYDPAYGRYEIPYNENTRYPYPLYRLAFGVKR